MKKAFIFVSSLSLVLFFTLSLGQAPVFAQVSQPTAANSGAGTNSSYNWAGYVSQSGSYTAVSGTWTVPNIAATSGFTADAQWVGIGGVKSQDLIQAGTQAITQNNAVTYQAWYELLPGVSQNINLTLNPGDSITTSLNQTSTGIWQINMHDNTNGQNFSTSVPYSSSLSSAEWIEEMPSQSNGGFIPLDNFGTVQFSNGSTVVNGVSENISLSGAQAITMLNTQDQTLASVSALGSDGASFTVTRTSATAGSLGTNPFGGQGGQGFRRHGSGAQGFTQTPMPFRTQRSQTRNRNGHYRISFQFFNNGMFGGR